MFSTIQYCRWTFHFGVQLKSFFDNWVFNNCPRIWTSMLQCTPVGFVWDATWSSRKERWIRRCCWAPGVALRVNKNENKNDNYRCIAPECIPMMELAVHAGKPPMVCSFVALFRWLVVFAVTFGFYVYARWVGLGLQCYNTGTHVLRILVAVFVLWISFECGCESICLFD